MTPRDFSQIPDAMRTKNAASNPPGQELGEAPLQSSVRDEYLEQRRRVIAELTKCHEDTEVLGPLIQELRSITKLQESFSFSDAMTFSAHSSSAEGESAVHALKSRIAMAVQHHAGQAESLCRTPDERSAFMGRLEQQFQEVQSTLVEQERQRCADKLLALCDRVDFIVKSLETFPVRSRQHEALLRLMARSVRAYANENLGQPAIQVGPLDLSDRQGLGRTPSISITQFLKILDDVSVEVLFAFVDQAAA